MFPPAISASIRKICEYWLGENSMRPGLRPHAGDTLPFTSPDHPGVANSPARRALAVNFPKIWSSAGGIPAARPASGPHCTDHTRDIRKDLSTLPEIGNWRLQRLSNASRPGGGSGQECAGSRLDRSSNRSATPACGSATSRPLFERPSNWSTSSACPANRKQRHSVSLGG